MLMRRSCEIPHAINADSVVPKKRYVTAFTKARLRSDSRVSLSYTTPLKISCCCGCRCCCAHRIRISATSGREFLRRPLAGGEEVAHFRAAEHHAVFGGELVVLGLAIAWVFLQ